MRLVEIGARAWTGHETERSSYAARRSRYRCVSELGLASEAAIWQHATASFSLNHVTAKGAIWHSAGDGFNMAGTLPTNMARCIKHSMVTDRHDELLKWPASRLSLHHTAAAAVGWQPPNPECH